MDKLKPLEWVGSSLDDLKKFPEHVKSEIGFALHRAQEGKKHKSAKPFKGLNGVFEIVSPYMSDTYRAAYAIKIKNKIYVLHAFQKKSKTGIKTSKRNTDLIKERLKNAEKLALENEK